MRRQDVPPEPAAGNRWSITHASIGGPHRGAVAAMAEDMLSPEERDRALQMTHGARRSAFVIGRFLIRTMLGRSMRMAMPDVPIHRNASGQLSTDTPWHLSLAHSGSCFLIAIATAPVGVDLETNPFWNEKLARRFDLVTDTTRMMRSESAKAHDLARAWTVREACVKATGGGLADIRRVQATADDAGSWNGIEWEVLPLREGHGAVARKGLDLRPGLLTTTTLARGATGLELRIKGQVEVPSLQAS